MEGDIDLDDTFDEVVQKVLASNINALKETQTLLKRDHFEQVIQCFHNATRICFYGVGTSMTTAMKAADKFLKIESKVYCASDSHIQAMMASTMTKGEVAVVFSYSGATKDTIHAVSYTHLSEVMKAIQGSADFLEGKTDNLEGVEIDGNKITVNFDTVSANALAVFSQWPILPKHCLEKASPETLQQDQ